MPVALLNATLLFFIYFSLSLSLSLSLNIFPNFLHFSLYFLFSKWF